MSAPGDRTRCKARQRAAKTGRRPRTHRSDCGDAKAIAARRIARDQPTRTLAK
jgi:hypothetical protein